MTVYVIGASSSDDQASDTQLSPTRVAWMVGFAGGVDADRRVGEQRDATERDELAVACGAVPDLFPTGQGLPEHVQQRIRVPGVDGAQEVSSGGEGILALAGPAGRGAATVVALFGDPALSIAGVGTVRLFDIGGLVAAAGLTMALCVATVRNTAALARQEPRARDAVTLSSLA